MSDNKSKNIQTKTEEFILKRSSFIVEKSVYVGNVCGGLKGI